VLDLSSHLLRKTGRASQARDDAHHHEAETGNLRADIVHHQIFAVVIATMTIGEGHDGLRKTTIGQLAVAVLEVVDLTARAAERMLLALGHEIVGGTERGHVHAHHHEGDGSDLSHDLGVEKGLQRKMVSTLTATYPALAAVHQSQQAAVTAIVRATDTEALEMSLIDGVEEMTMTDDACLQLEAAAEAGIAAVTARNRAMPMGEARDIDTRLMRLTDTFHPQFSARISKISGSKTDRGREVVRGRASLRRGRKAVRERKMTVRSGTEAEETAVIAIAAETVTPEETATTAATATATATGEKTTATEVHATGTMTTDTTLAAVAEGGAGVSKGNTSSY
jgi:hypothetical protein